MGKYAKPRLLENEILSRATAPLCAHPTLKWAKVRGVCAAGNTQKLKSLHKRAIIKHYVYHRAEVQYQACDERQ